MNKKGNLNNNQDKEFVVIDSFTYKMKNSLKAGFGSLFNVIESIFTSKKNNNIEKTIFIEDDEIKIDDMKSDEIIELEAVSVDNNDLKECVEIFEEDNQIKKSIDAMKAFCDDLQTSIDDVVLKQKRNKEEKIKVLKKEFISINEEIDSIAKKIEIISLQDDNIKNTRNSLIALKDDIFKIKKQYDALRFENDIQVMNSLKPIDSYNLRYNGKQINILLQKCDMELSKIKKRQKDLLNVSEEDISGLKSSIDGNLQKQQIEINELKKEFNNVSIDKKRSVFIMGIDNFLVNTFNLQISLVPVCKNKFLKVLESMVILNNRIRNMRKIISKENDNINYIKYDELLEFINTKTLCSQKLQEIIDDSFLQIENLKQEFMLEFYYDLERYHESDSIMESFSNIEYQLKSRSIELENNVGVKII